MAQSGGEGEALLPALRERASPVPAPRSEIKLIEEFIGAGIGASAIKAVSLGVEANVFFDAQIVVKTKVLCDITNA